MVGEQHVSADPRELGYDVVARRRLAPRARRRAGRGAPDPRAPGAALLPLRGLLRDPPRLLRADVGARRALLDPAPRTCPTRRSRGTTWRPSSRARARSTTASARCSARWTSEGIADDTLVIFTTDHGLPFPGAKATLSDRGIGVLLIMRGPGGFHGGRVSDALISQIDLFPTLCDLAGIALPAAPAGPLAAPARPRGDRRGQRRHLRRADLPRGLRPAARDPHAPPQVRPPLRRPRPARAGQRRRQPEQGPAARGRLGRPAAAARGALRPRARPRRGAQPGRRPRARRRARRAARPARRVDAHHGRPAAARAGGAAARRRVQRPRRRLRRRAARPESGAVR